MARVQAERNRLAKGNRLAKENAKLKGEIAALKIRIGLEIAAVR